MSLQRHAHLIALCCAVLMPTLAGHADYATTVINDNPIAYYRFSETSGNTFATQVGSTNATLPAGGDVDLTVSGPTLAGFGPTNSAVGFNGDLDGDTNDVITANLSGSNYSYTLEFWTQGGSSGVVAAFTAQITGNRFFGGRVNNSPVAAGDLSVDARDGTSVENLDPAGIGGDATAGSSTPWFRYDSDLGVGDSTWSYVALVFTDAPSDPTRLYKTEVYVDPTGGTPLGTIFHNVAPDSFVNRLSIGAKHTQSSNTDFFDGLIDEVAIYDYALTGAQIQNHYNAAIPEPGTVGLIVVGLGLCLTRRRR